MLPLFPQRYIVRGVALAAAIAAAAAPLSVSAQTDQPGGQSPPAAAQNTSAGYHPPLRGAPGGRVGGASRGSTKLATPLPTIDLVAPYDHAGLTVDPAPTLYFFVSGAVAFPTQLTISATLQPAPILEVMIPSPRAAGLYAVHLSGYRVKLDPGIAYTWSVSIIVDPKAWSRNVVASATMLRASAEPAMEAAARTAPALRRAVLFAQNGFWYDAVAAASEAENIDHHAALDGLMEQVGLMEPAAYDRVHQ